MLSLWVAVGAIIFIYYFTEWYFKWRKMPPGPWGLPILGIVHKIDPKRPWETLVKMDQKFGPMCTYTATHGNLSVALNEWEDVLELYSKPEITARPFTVFTTITSFGLNAGLLTSQGKTWRDNRRFSARTLRDFGLGKTSLNDVIMCDVANLMDRIGKLAGKPQSLDLSVNACVVNILSRIMANEPHDLDDPKLLDFFEKIASMQLALSGIGLFSFYRPWLFNFSREGRQRKATIGEYMHRCQQLQEIIDEHKRTREDSFDRDFVDAYLREITNGKVDPQTMNETQLMYIIHSLYFGGTDTSAASLKWTFFLLAKYPAIQEKAQEEIERLVGQSRPVSIDDKKNLPFIEATVLEVLRFALTIPMIVRQCTQDVDYKGYVFPKGTSFVANGYGIHMSEKYWKEPKTFDPARFLDEQGNARQGKIRGFMPFGLGKRQCIGESLAKMELFLFTANFLQRFNFREVPGEPLPDPDDATYVSVSRRLPDFKIIVEERQ